MKWPKLIYLLFVPLLLWSSCNQKDERWHEVTKVIDGDTFWIDEKEKVRLIGIDAPESRNTGRKKIGYYGKEAKEHLIQFLSGKRVELKFDVGERDQYHRLLAYVYLEDGTFLNAELVKLGYARVYTVPPNVRHADLFLQMQQEAREQNRGLWGMESPE